MATKKRKRVRRQTSASVSRLASKWLRRFDATFQSSGLINERDKLTIGELKALCASVLSQDERKGQ